MGSDRVKVGIVGCGAVATDRHLPVLSRLQGSGVHVAAVCDVNRDLAAAAARAFAVPNVYNHIEDMIAAERLDIVDVCVPPASHALVARAAMEGGCHVLLEKPMATSVADCDLMIEISKRQGVQLGVIHNNSFHHGYTEFQNRIEQKVVGGLCGLRIYWTTPPQEMLSRENHWAHKLPGGLIGETMPHIVYLALPFVGNVENLQVYAWKMSDYPWVDFDNYSFLFQGTRAIASVVLSYTNNSHVVWFDALGTEGVLHLDLINRTLQRRRCGTLSLSAVGRSIVSDMTQAIGSTVKGVFSRMVRSDYAGCGHDRAIVSFVRSVADGSPLQVTAMNGRETVRVVDMLVRQVQSLPRWHAGHRAGEKTTT